MSLREPTGKGFSNRRRRQRRSSNKVSLFPVRTHECICIANFTDLSHASSLSAPWPLLTVVCMDGFQVLLLSVLEYDVEAIPVLFSPSFSIIRVTLSAAFAVAPS